MAGPAPEIIRQMAKHDFFLEYIAFQVKLFASRYNVQAGVRVALHRQQFISWAEILLKYGNAEGLPKHFTI